MKLCVLVMHAVVDVSRVVAAFFIASGDLGGLLCMFFFLGLVLLLLLSAGFHQAVLLPSVRAQMLCEVLQQCLGRKARQAKM